MKLFQIWKYFFFFVQLHEFYFHNFSLLLLFEVLLNLTHGSWLSLCLGDEEPHLNLAEKLRWHAAKFLLQIRETCRISQTAIDHIIDGVQDLMVTYSSIILVMLRISWCQGKNTHDVFDSITLGGLQCNVLKSKYFWRMKFNSMQILWPRLFILISWGKRTKKNFHHQCYSPQ